MTNPSLVAGILEDHHPVADFDQDVPPRIAVLLFARCPSHVAGLIAPIVVDPIERHVGGGSAAYAPEKLIETSGPRLGHTDAATAIVRVCAISLAEAPSLDVLPEPVFFGATGPMPAVACSNRIPLRATARGRQARPKRLPKDNNRLPTLAPASPRGPTRNTSLSTLNKQSTEHRASYINCL